MCWLPDDVYCHRFQQQPSRRHRRSYCISSSIHVATQHNTDGWLEVPTGRTLHCHPNREHCSRTWIRRHLVSFSAQANCSGPQNAKTPSHELSTVNGGFGGRVVRFCRFLVCCEWVRRTDDDGNETTTAMTDDWDLRPSCYTRRGYTETNERRLTECYRALLFCSFEKSACFPRRRNSTIDAEETSPQLYTHVLVKLCLNIRKSTISKHHTTKNMLLFFYQCNAMQCFWLPELNWAGVWSR